MQRWWVMPFQTNGGPVVHCAPLPRAFLSPLISIRLASSVPLSALMSQSPPTILSLTNHKSIGGLILRIVCVYFILPWFLVINCLTIRKYVVQFFVNSISFRYLFCPLSRGMLLVRNLVYFRLKLSTFFKHVFIRYLRLDKIAKIG